MFKLYIFTTERKMEFKYRVKIELGETLIAKPLIAVSLKNFNSACMYTQQYTH